MTRGVCASLHPQFIINTKIENYTNNLITFNYYMLHITLNKKNVNACCWIFCALQFTDLISVLFNAYFIFLQFSCTIL